MNTSHKLSIIVPVYNVEQYLRECLDSIKSQTFTDFEVLLINDGSPDKSGSICDEYAAKDLRFKVYHKENSGVSSARNLGLDNARGEWIAFIDPDDSLTSDKVYEEIFEKDLSDIDLIHFGYKFGKNIDSTRDNLPEIYGMHEGKHELSELHVFFKHFTSVCMNIFRTTLIGNLKFENLKIAEDALFIRTYMLRAKKILIINKPYYFYRVVANSAIRSYKPTYIDDRLAYVKKLRALYQENPYCDQDIFNDDILDMFMYAMMSEINHWDDRTAKERLKEYVPKFGVREILTWKKVLEINTVVRLFLKIEAYNLLYKYVRKKMGWNNAIKNRRQDGLAEK